MGSTSYTDPISPDQIASLRADILAHFANLGLPNLNGGHPTSLTKDAIRTSHAYQRQENLRREIAAIGSHRLASLLQHIANGAEVIPEKIDPELVPVYPGQETGWLFRFACLFWSVPVSKGYGRRMRYLVRDRFNGKLIGIFALGDPVFNLQARDKWIGWDVNDRRARLVHLMDAYVVGAVPPYNQLLGGKLIFSLIASQEVGAAFSARYSATQGIISGEQKAARLVLVTVTSALGRSSLYNRLKLTGSDGEQLLALENIGETRGYGHFQLSNGLFERLRNLLSAEEHKYASGHQYGDGPNWRMRLIRVGLKRLGLDEELIRHGIERQVFALPLAPNFRDILLGRVSTPTLERPPASVIASAALERWILPRANRDVSFYDFNRDQVLEKMSVTQHEE